MTDFKDWARDTIAASANSFAATPQQAYDALFHPVSQRPMAQAVNDLFGTRIEHNSLADILLHMAWVNLVCVTLGSVVGLALGLTAQAVNMVILGAQLAWHLAERDGVVDAMLTL